VIVAERSDHSNKIRPATDMHPECLPLPVTVLNQLSVFSKYSIFIYQIVKARGKGIKRPQIFKDIQHFQDSFVPPNWCSLSHGISICGSLHPITLIIIDQL